MRKTEESNFSIYIHLSFVSFTEAPSKIQIFLKWNKILWSGNGKKQHHER